MLAPCNYVLEEYGYTGDKITEECKIRGRYTATDQWNYLWNFNAKIYLNNEILDTESYGDQSIKRFSEIKSVPVRYKTPTLFNIDIETNVLKDSTDLFQLTETEDK